MSIDIIIVTYNAKKNLKRCMKSIRTHTLNTPYKLLIVDNNSKDGTSEFLNKYGDDIKIIHNEKNLGFSAAANIAIKATSSEYIVLIDDDAEVTKNWLKKLYGKINKNPDIGVAGCKIVCSKKKIYCAEINVVSGQFRNIGYGEKDKGQRNYVKEVYAVNGACWLMRRSVVKKIGLFDEQFFPCQYEDLDYCLRVGQAGFRVVYNGKVSIIHYNLYREGGIKTLKANLRKFMKKWNNLKYFVSPQEFKDNCIDELNFKLKEFVSKALKLEREGRYAEAIKYFQKAIRVNPKSTMIAQRLAILYKKIGRPNKAKSHAYKSLNIFDARHPRT